MSKCFGKIILIIIATVFLGGCGFFSGKETEIIKSQEDVVIEKQEKTEESISETEAVNKDSISEDNSNNVEEKKAEAVESSQEKEKTEGDIVEENSNKPPKITNKLVSWGFSTSDSRKIDTIIIHSSYNAVGSDVHDLDDIIYKEYKPYGVSPHYIISREGKIYRLVKDKDVAYHAGESKVPDGRTGVNNFSIGIEIVNTKSEKPNDSQYSALKNLLAYLKSEYKIKYVLGHKNIAPGRKDDPWNFDFGKIK
ncbi:MAG: N-acetylmuramoyl-L-alanine amidase [Candidatus Moraniibacteriota bacterium]